MRMWRTAPGGIFRREARWMLWLALIPVLVAVTMIFVVPRLARFFR
jgi:hypothetical protein